MLDKFSFSVIYSVDTPEDEPLHYYLPPISQSDLWDETETSYEDWGYAYLGGRWEHGHHTKRVAVLNYEQFAAFIDEVGLFAEDVRTGGSIGGPGLCPGISPAISFTGRHDAIQDAYVTPIPAQWDKENEKWVDLFGGPLDEEAWETVRDLVLEEWS